MFAPNKSSSSLGSFCCLLTGFQGNKFHPLSTAFKDRESVWLCQMWIFPGIRQRYGQPGLWQCPHLSFSQGVSCLCTGLQICLKLCLELDSFTRFCLAQSNQWTRLQPPNLWHHYFFLYFSHCSWMQCWELKICGIFLCYRCKLSFSHN